MKSLSSDLLRVRTPRRRPNSLAPPLALDVVQHDIVHCARCPRLRTYCARVAREKKRAFRTDDYWGRPVPGFGDANARVLLVGLAPAAHGANRTGRPFTGDGPHGSSDFLMAGLHRLGFSNKAQSTSVDDGLRLSDVFITMAVRCAPPANKPFPEEIDRCLSHLDAETSCLPRVRVVIGLGKIGFDAWLRLCRYRGMAMSPRPAFGHGEEARLPDRTILMGCYHPSRQNTNTGTLTPSMLDEVLHRARTLARR